MLAIVPRRYPIATLDAEGLDVWLTVGERELVGQVRFTQSGKPRYQQRVNRKLLTDLPKQAVVSLWRPIDENVWPYELPEPAVLTVEKVKQAPAVSEPEEAIAEGPGWPHPGVRLGRPNEAPESVEEVEARLLRALRTKFQEERPDTTSETLWLRSLMVKAKVRHKELEASPTGVLVGFRKQDYDDFHVDRSDLRPIPVKWCPTPRDVSDYEAGIHTKWLGHVRKKDRWLFAARAKNPPMSWRQIAEEENEHEIETKRRYRDALKTILRMVGR